MNSCVLATLTVDHRISLYVRDRWVWRELDQPSIRWTKHLESRQWSDIGQQIDQHASVVFDQYQRRSYMLATIGNNSSRFIFFLKKKIDY